VRPVEGLRFEPVSLQDLVVRTTQTNGRALAEAVTQGGAR